MSCSDRWIDGITCAASGTLQSISGGLNTQICDDVIVGDTKQQQRRPETESISGADPGLCHQGKRVSVGWLFPDEFSETNVAHVVPVTQQPADPLTCPHVAALPTSVAGCNIDSFL